MKKLNITRIVVVLGCSLLVGAACGSPRVTESSSETSQTHAGTEVPTSPQAALPRADYDVHEWGLMRVQVGDEWTAGAVAGQRRPEPLVVDKPVLYFHMLSSTPIQISNIGVQAIGGTIREHWPLSSVVTPTPPRVSWDNVEIANRTCTPGPLPDIGMFPCNSLGYNESCESPELAVVRTDDSACVHTSRGDDSMLFYRSTNATYSPPVALERLSATNLRLRNNGTQAMPGAVFRFHRERDGIRIAEGTTPSPGQTSILGSAYFDAARARVRIRAALVTMGLTESEADAFVRAWDTAFFETRTTDGELAVDELTDRRRVQDGLVATDIADRPDAPSPTDTVLYFLPSADIENISSLSFSPAPRRIVRVMAVWAAVPN